MINTATGIELNLNYPGETILRVIVGTTFELIFIFLLLHAFRLKSEKTLPYKLLATFLAINIIYFVLVNTTWKFNIDLFNQLVAEQNLILGFFLPGFPPYFFIGIEIVRFVAGIFVIYIYSTIKPVVRMNKFPEIANLWKTVGILFALIGAGSIVQLILTFSGTWEAAAYNAWGNFVWLVAAGMDLVFLVIAVRFPEGLLITEAQVFRACRAYAVIKTYPAEEQPGHFGMDRIKAYLDDIPESIWEVGCK